MTEAKHTEKMIDSAPAHVFPDDLERLESSECTATVYSVPMGDLDRGETVPLFSANSHYALVEALEAALEWIDSVPDDVQLPVMPGFDRDHVNNVLAKAKGES